MGSWAGKIAVKTDHDCVPSRTRDRRIAAGEANSEQGAEMTEGQAVGTPKGIVKRAWQWEYYRPGSLLREKNILENENNPWF